MGSEVEVTAADREKAEKVLADAGMSAMDRWQYTAPVAQALAEERAKARARAFSDAADVWEGKGAGWLRRFRIAEGSHSGYAVAAWLRRAAEDPT